MFYRSLYRLAKHTFVAALFCGIFAASATLAQEVGTARAVVTAVPKSSEASTDVPQQTITVAVNGKRQDISGWVPLRGNRGALELAILLDDSSVSSFGGQLQDIRSFLGMLPPTVKVAIAYMRNGTAAMAQGFTTDHQAAANALHLPAGIPGGNGSPYFCLQDLIKRWPEGGSQEGNIRREVIMLTSGDDPYSGRAYNPDDPYLQSAIKDAQRAGIVVYSIYYRGQGRFDRGGYAAMGGQSYLLQLSSATGGEVYTQGFGNPVSLQPFLRDIWNKLQNQYELTVAATPRKDLVRIQVKTNQPNTKLLAPAQAPVRADQTDQ